MKPMPGIKSSGRYVAISENNPGIIAAIIANKMATLIELQTVYGCLDAYRMYEMCIVNSYNMRPTNDNSN